MFNSPVFVLFFSEALRTLVNLVSQHCCVFSRKACMCSQTMLGGLLDLNCSAVDTWNVQLLVVPIISTLVWRIKMNVPADSRCLAKLPWPHQSLFFPCFFPCHKCNFFLCSYGTWEDVGAGGKESVYVCSQPYIVLPAAASLWEALMLQIRLVCLPCL